MTDVKGNVSDQYKGWLSKWTNYLKGYQKRWFVLQNGLLSYYRNPNEVAHTCRGTINLANTFIHTTGSTNIVISSGGTHTFHLKAASESERKRWVTALELAKALAITLMAEEDDDEEVVEQPDKNELQNIVRSLSTKLEDLNTCNDLITKHGAGLTKSLSELEQLDNPGDVSAKLKGVNERATLFRITSNAMINACHDYLALAQNQGKRWQRMLQHEHEQRLRLEEMVEQLAKQHSSLEKHARKSFAVNANQLGEGGPPLSDDSDEEDFFDAPQHVEAHPSKEFKVCLPGVKSHKRTGSGMSMESDGPTLSPTLTEDNYDSSDTDSDTRREQEISVVASTKASSEGGLQKKPAALVLTRKVSKRQRRKLIPERPNYSINIWSIMKNSIGKELTKIALPVNICEPISFLQRLTEDYEYSDILDQAALLEDSCEQLAYVAAFTVSSYATLTNRTGKPFNPLLGETFECDRRDDMGWRSIGEQVSHHPPVAAMYVEAKDWSSWVESSLSSKFRGKYVQIIPLGIAHLEFTKSKNHYTWRKVTTTAHNIIVGKLWVDNHGEMDITNHKTGDNCHMKFSAYSYFSRETPRKVTGVITNSSGKATWVVQGTWDEQMECAKILNTTQGSNGKLVYETGEERIIWQRRYPPPELEKCYGFTQFAIELNEMEDGIAPTDSRHRPDQRCMEEGRWDDANKAKQLNEEKQRAARREREREAKEAAQLGQEYIGYQPRWFHKETDPQTGNLIHVFTQEYWECKERQDWQRCPDIYV